MRTEIVAALLAGETQASGGALSRSAGMLACERRGGDGRGGDGGPREADRRWRIEVDIDLRGDILDAEYWLRHCQGFLVHSDSGKNLGVVEEVELAPDSRRAAALVVVSGWFGRHVEKIGVSQVRAIIPCERRLIVKDAATRARGSGHGRV